MSILSGNIGIAVVVCVILAMPGVAVADSSAAHCSDPTEAYYLDDGFDYHGHVNVTVDGIPCQMWTAMFPHMHDTDPKTAGIGNHNYCRNVLGLDSPGCFTTDPKVRYQLCNVGPPCPLPSNSPSVYYNPPSGSHVILDGGHNMVSLTCFPKPCEIYYSVDDTTPAVGEGTKYTAPFALTKNTTVKAIGRFSDGREAGRIARYTVSMPAELLGVTFYPSDSVAYSEPVLVSIRGVTATDDVVLYINDRLTAYTFGNPFWLKESSTLIAVVNGKVGARASYSIHVLSMPIFIDPPSGQYLGGVRALVIPTTVEPTDYRLSINGSSWELMKSMLFTLDTPGTTEVRVSATSLGGVLASARVVYTVIAAVPPVIQPSAATEYMHPVNVTCKDPLGNLLTLGSTEEGEDIWHAHLSTPGAYHFNCSYVDYLRVRHVSTETLHLVAHPLVPPLFTTPICGSVFPETTLMLQFRLLGQSPGRGGTSVTTNHSSSWEQMSPLVTVAGGKTTLVVRHANGYDFTCAVEPDGTATPLAVTVRTVSIDPFETMSETTTCEFTVQPLANTSTPLTTIRPGCVGLGDRNISDACMTTVAQQLASCLSFYTVDLIEVTPYGSHLSVAVTGLPDSLRATMAARVTTCLSHGAINGSDVRTESNGDLKLALSWRALDVSTGVTLSSKDAVLSDSFVFVSVSGYRVSEASYRFVRRENSCDDIGIRPLTASVNAAMRMMGIVGTDATAAYQETSDEAYFLFALSTPGTYKLCVQFGSDFVYEVPPQASAVMVVHTPLPELTATRPCGGRIDESNSHVPVMVSFAAEGGLYWSYYTANGGPWRPQQLSQSVTLGTVDTSTNPVEAVTTSLGATNGAAMTCVFYAPAVKPVDTSDLHYSFYEMSNEFRLPHKAQASTSVDTLLPGEHGSTDVVMVVQGSFQRGERVVLELYRNVSTPASYANEWHLNESLIERHLVLLSRTLATSSSGFNYSLALPDRALRVPYGNATTALLLRAVLDGVPVQVAPMAVGLSPLAIAMVPCGECKSNYCYEDQCVCTGAVNKTAYLCGKASDGDGDDEETPSTSLTERLVLLFLYFGLLSGIGVGFFIAIKRGSERSLVDSIAARDLTVIDMSAPVNHEAEPTGAAMDREINSACSERDNEPPV